MNSLRAGFPLRPWQKALAVIAGGLLTSLAHTDAATRSAASPTLVDVTAAIASASDGDTVVVPAGTATWTSVLTITKGITLVGATTVTKAGTQEPTVSDLTVIQDDSPPNTQQSGLIQAKLKPGQSFRLTGFTFRHGSRISSNNNGAVHLRSDPSSSPVTSIRVDHCHFDHIYGRNIQTDGWVYGVADHNYIEAQGNGQSVYVNCVSYGGYSQGHGAWADYPWFGTANFFFFEDNTVVGGGGSATSGAADSTVAGRAVYRHNYWKNARIGWHGTEGTLRGGRAFEIYDNTFDFSINYSSMMRSGTALVHDNTWVGKQSGHPIHHAIVIYREAGGVGANNSYLPAAGTSPWDVNDTEGNGTYVVGHPPHLFDSGTATSGTAPTSNSSAQATMTDTSKNWTNNQWAGYSITQMNPKAASYKKGSYICSNTQKTITYYYYGSADRGPGLLFASGDAYQIFRVLTAVDQVGRGKGDLLRGGGNPGSSPTNTVTGTQQWPHEAAEPAMSWNNVYTPNNTVYGFGSQIPTEVQGRDYYNLGKGFAADSTPSQVSSIYTAAVNGTNYTGTYTYPHPLVSNVPTAPNNRSLQEKLHGHQR